MSVLAMIQEDVEQQVYATTCTLDRPMPWWLNE